MIDSQKLLLLLINFLSKYPIIIGLLYWTDVTLWTCTGLMLWRSKNHKIKEIFLQSFGFKIIFSICCHYSVYFPWWNPNLSTFICESKLLLLKCTRVNFNLSTVEFEEWFWKKRPTWESGRNFLISISFRYEFRTGLSWSNFSIAYLSEEIYSNSILTNYLV